MILNAQAYFDMFFSTECLINKTLPLFKEFAAKKHDCLNLKSHTFQSASYPPHQEICCRFPELYFRYLTVIAKLLNAYDHIQIPGQNAGNPRNLFPLDADRLSSSCEVALWFHQNTSTMQSGWNWNCPLSNPKLGSQFCLPLHHVCTWFKKGRDFAAQKLPWQLFIHLAYLDEI